MSLTAEAPSLKKYILLSIVVAVITIGMKATAYLLTSSVGLLSDALESCVNLIAAIAAYFILIVAEKPADEEHAFGHSKAEYFSSSIEGSLILLAAVSIIWSAMPRLLDPQPIENVNIGLIISAGASLLNLAVAIILLRAGKKANSITLEADGHHLMTDVWTSVGVVGGILLVKLTGWNQLDPIIAILVAINIIWMGYKLLLKSVRGLLDTAITKEERQQVEAIFKKYCNDQIQYHSLMTRQAGQRKFISVHILVPGDWSVQKGHDLLEEIEEAIREQFNRQVTIFTHLEPVEDPISHNDIGIYR